MKKLPKFKSTFLFPRYWMNWTAICLIMCIIFLPYSFLRKIGNLLGKITFNILKRRVNIARCNLQLCLPELSNHERTNILKKNFDSIGMGIIETGIAWFWPDSRIYKLFTINGYENIQNALKKGKGILLIGIHFLTLEIGIRILGILNPGIIVYRPNNNELLNWLQIRGRLRSNKNVLNRKNLIGMIHALKKNEIVWYAPDHDYGKRSSLFVPFFNVCDAATTAGTYILIKNTNAAIIPFIPKRKSNNQGYELTILPDISPELNLKDKQDTTIKINKTIEKMIIKAPEQYMWIHRRFKTRPSGQVPLY